VITGRRNPQFSVEHGLFSLSKVIFEFHSVMLCISSAIFTQEPILYLSCPSAA
jgi:hypothetical protein